MNIERKILEELKRFNQINSYVLNEQPEPELGGAPPPPPAPDMGGMPPPPPADAAAGDAAAGDTPPADAAAGDTPTVPEPVDIENDPDVEEVGDKDKESDGDTEEIDITDLVTAQNDIKSKQDEFMDSLFSKLDDLEGKLVNMDQIMDKINSLETKFDKYREKTPEEKLMLRSLDSYPYNQKLSDFFDDKKDEMEETGKNEYVLTSDDVEDFSPNEIKGTFNEYEHNKVRENALAWLADAERDVAMLKQTYTQAAKFVTNSEGEIETWAAKMSPEEFDQTVQAQFDIFKENFLKRLNGESNETN